MIFLDTTMLVYAVGAEHALREPARRLVAAISSGQLRATTTPEVIQEFTDVRARRAGRLDSARLAGRFARLLSPLTVTEPEDLDAGLALFAEHGRLGAFDAVLAAVAIAHGAEALVSADRAFGDVAGLHHVDPSSDEYAALLA